ncbi:MAG: hypothetical protein CMM74_16085 [Rhodospirillaceae bacterium]|nr:hypothetical protein [Rhodospirillaceae bacterium]
MSTRTIRSSALAITFIARQFGVRINADFVENAIQQGTLSNSKELAAFFAKQRVLAKPRNSKTKDLLDKSYMFPCVGIMKNGQALILIGADNQPDDDVQHIITIDPTDPTAKPSKIETQDFDANWSKKLILVSHLTENISQNRIFDWWWFLPEFGRFKSTLFLTFIMSLIVHALGVAPIIYIQISLDKVLGYEATSTLYVLTAGIIIALVFSGILAFARDFIINHIATVIEARLTGDAFDKMLKLPAQMFQTTSASEIEGNVQSVNAIRLFISRQILTNLFDAAGILVFVPVLIGYSPILALVVIFFSVIQGIIDLISKKQSQRMGQFSGSAGAARTAVLRETISGIDTVKALSQETIQRKQWRDASAKAIRLNVNSAKIGNLSASINSTLMNLMTVAIIFTGINLVFAGALSAGAIISCNMLGAKVVAPVKGLITFFADTNSVKDAMEKMGSIWNANPERVGVGPQHVISGNYVFKNLAVKFGEDFALADISGKIPGRKKIAVVGPSAAGKSTLLRLLQGLLRPSSGTVEIDEHNLASIDLDHYRHQVALVDNFPTFFMGSIEENIRRVRPNISSREFENILDISGLGTITNDFSDGLATPLDVTGSSLSQAHKLTVALARALASSPNLLMLDETVNSLDKMAQVQFKNNLSNIAEGRTLIVATNDLRFISSFDWILVLENGKIVGQGQHEELLEKCPLYVQLFELERELSSDV